MKHTALRADGSGALEIVGVGKSISGYAQRIKPNPNSVVIKKAPIQNAKNRQNPMVTQSAQLR